MATTCHIPLALLTVQPDSANVFWTSTNNSGLDQGFIRYVDSGEGISTWYGTIPTNVAATPAWNLIYYCVANTAGSGNVMVTAKGAMIQNGQIANATLTMLSSAAAIALFRSDTMNIVAASGGNFDSPLAAVATAMVVVELNRHGGNASDTINSAWDLWGVSMRIDVT